MNRVAKASRLAHVDYLRAGCVLYIVGFWHLMEYAPGWAGWQNSVTSGITVVVLGLFVFVSGFLLAQRPPDRNLRGLLEFYNRRLLRIYPLYLVALLIFGLMGLAGWRSVTLSAAGLSMLIGPAPFTLWFVVMLLAYYLVAPLLLSTNGWWLVVVAAGLLAVAALVVKLSPGADPRLVLYLPAFILGIWHAKRGVPVTHLYGGLALLIVLVVASASVSIGGFGLTKFALLVALATLGAYAVFVAAELYRGWFVRCQLVEAVSCAAFVMYLAHRPFYEVMTRLFMPATAGAQLAYLALVCLPVVMVASWLIQRGYDTALARRS